MPFAVGKCYTQTHFLHFDLAFPRQFFLKKKYFVFFIKAKTLSLSLSHQEKSRTLGESAELRRTAGL